VPQITTVLQWCSRKTNPVNKREEKSLAQSKTVDIGQLV